MKKLLSVLILSFLLLTFLLREPALAEGVLSGSTIFSNSCAACHINGNNVIVANKTLKKKALTKYLKGYEENPLAAIINQVTNGKNAMPNFKSRLTAREITTVAAYVAEQAEKAWSPLQ
ncbi:cytochrome c6 PetJ [Planktothrix agardhii]|uniref:Cytochrome c domain-containing protein n=3 Tax=Planktothrix agardhii TaxID=1160 RepID=A0A073CJN1_PLAA1|nr:c-type cytochrome [Planktothrix agardhii]MCB8750503.1 c-type cytochrome [Planktothrix agardhii 1810]MCB8759261.1 c-type cytochrome [Planktothrix agardhii 1813]MCF3565921.1 c-type cytochrome [Planktothrix agardhii 1807]MCF3571637.1 c-type cytochrome [Planktothrix agardhii 1805]MCF3585470.1 c-type cytochrome [Planktothrix agardhii 1803]MCF3589104.1 c-type cytochrome [Planktothrix agardhii 1029]MCF3597874.1 c-type cytochrome [Planktothrix agardhii 1032]MCF3602147.1 c-type cytochrome [Plankt